MRVKISSVIQNQLPSYVRDEFPLVEEFLSQYYLSMEGQGLPSDLIQNIDRYIKIENLTNLVTSTTVTSFVGFFDDVIYVNSTKGFPESYGLIQIDSEIITYTGITENSFTGCIRGFSGITSYKNSNKPDELVFSSSEVATHSTETSVSNLSVIFLQEFFNKIKKQITPGFENRELYSDINQRVFIQQAKDFYSTKGTNQSFEILFRALYGEDVEVIKPRDYLLIPSDAQYRVTRDIVVEALEGNPEDLVNRTLFQDKTEVFPAASGSVTNVQRIQRGNNTYYVLSLDYDYNKDINVEGSLFGRFSIHPTTKLITSANIGDSVLDVDSTVGFPSSGTLIVKHSDGTSSNISYKSKSLNQFFECSGINRIIQSNELLRFDSYAYGYSGLSTSNVVRVRVTGVLSDLDKLPESYYYETGDLIQIKSPGIELKDTVSNQWIFNLATSYEVKSVSLENSLIFSYKINTYDSHNFSIGDSAKLISSDGLEKTCEIASIIDEYSFIIQKQGNLNVNRSYIIKRILSKVKTSEDLGLSNYTTNVQNIYTDNESVYVTSNSIPSYLNQELDIKNRYVLFSGTFNGEDISVPNHGFYTGDSVTYRSASESNKLNISEGIYFVKKVDSNTIKLSRSKSNLYNQIYLSVSGVVNNNILEYTSFSQQSLRPQKIIRKISSPVNDNVQYETQSGYTGVLVNGVEILNYKSKDSIFYGPIEKINVTSEGNNYDVINPPILTITDSVGTGASGYCETEGSLKRIEILNSGFDYLETPVITITGGNGKGAIAKANLVPVQHSVSFNSISSAGQVDIINNTILLSEIHKFRDGESIIYKTNGEQSIGGLTEDSVYYISVIDAYKVKLHKTYTDAIFKINSIDFVSYGIGNHNLLATNNKKVIGSVTIIDSGAGYKNRRTTVTSSGINTSSNIINIKNHKYETGEIITYSSGTTPIGGLANGNYYVIKVDDDRFKLSSSSIGSTITDYIQLTSPGSGTHTFNYPEIKIEVSGKVGVSTISGQDLNAVLRPIFRGKIKSVFINSGGIGYGSSEILNYNRQPLIQVESGSGALLKPIIFGGKIKDVVILNPGTNYNSIPDILINGEGKGAELVPIISNGTIISVSIVNSGFGYNQNTTSIDVISSGSEAKFESSTKKWTVNLVERLFLNNQISDDDGVISSSINSDFELQYSHLYSPRKLRQIIFGSTVVNGEKRYVPDLQIENKKEIASKVHSPLIGWAYDGNPIYGPYGYATLTGGSIKPMKSGYSLKENLDLIQDRPSTSLYPEGFFVEDYEFKNDGDLDEHNGRFCITPDFPNGVYAYFTTIDTTSVESGSIFNNYRKPQFPFFIGNSYKSKPINYNFSKYSNQDDINLQETNLIRNTTPYNFSKNNSYYEFVYEPNRIQKQNTEIKFTNYGEIDSIKVISGGENYQVDDVVIFDNTETGGSGAAAKISSVYGKPIDKISIANTSILNVEIVPFGNKNNFVAFSTSPHNLKDSDIVSITGISTTSYKSDSFLKIGVTSSIYTLSNSVSTSSVTGIITYFNVSGNLNNFLIRENDIFKIENEKIKILNVDSVSSRIRVQREYDGTVGSAHSASTKIIEHSRKFTFKNSFESNEVNYDYSREIYFNPIETVGIGTTSGVGIGTTLIFSNPGIGLTQIYIPTKTLYITNHNLNTGDTLKYYSNGGSSIYVSNDGINSFQLTDSQTLYVAKVSNDLVGISTLRVGLGTTGVFVGINSALTTNTLYFTGIGTGENHSFKTFPENILSGDVNKNTVTISTASTHGLNINDRIYLNVITGITTTIKIAYNDHNRRLVVDPRAFISSDVNINENTIFIQNHNFFTGQKVIHTSNSSSGGLENNKIYYVYVIDENNFKLCSSFSNSISSNPTEINITSASGGTILKVNPPIIGEKNQTIIFDLSDSSLSFINNNVLYSAFDFNLYSDSNHKSSFYSTTSSSIFEVSKSGFIGISSNAQLIFKVNDYVPEKLYYNLEPINLNLNDDNKKEIISDSENIVNNNTLIVKNNVLTGDHTIVGVASTYFTFNIQSKPNKIEYNYSDGDFSYTTSSKNVYGEISTIKIISSGKNYKKLPGVSSIQSSYGKDAFLILQSKSIGKILGLDIQDIGFDYPVDKTLRPEAQYPQILRIQPFSSFKKIGISSVGKNYFSAPSLIVLDGLTNERILDVDLRYNVGDKEVKILKNTKSLNDVTPKIIPINNTNGVPISSVSFNSTTKDVIVSLGVSFSSLEDFPFDVGDKILIENINVGLNTTAKGYNSSNYNYSLFTLTQVTPNIGGSNGSVTYNLSNYLSNDETPGSFNSFKSSGIIVPEKYFPIFEIELIKNDFSKNETILSSSVSGFVNSWDNKNGYLKVSSIQDFSIGDTVIGSSSKSQGKIVEINKFNSFYKIDSSSIVKKGWNRETGFLNNNTQRIHNNDYYQYFSYSIRSKVQYETWNNPVSSLNHTAGFKKFSDLIIESKDNNAGINTEQDFGDFTGISDLVSVIDLNCVNDFDLATENNLIIDSNLYSDEIIFNSVILQDYIESIGNRVLTIDDISEQFNTNPRSTKYSIVDSFDIDSANSKKYIIYISDKITNEKEVILVTLVHDGVNGFLNQYARVENSIDLGFFDFTISGTKGELLFYPTNYKINNYNISFVTYSIDSDSIGIGTFTLGDTASIVGYTTHIPSGTSSPTTVVGIASTNRAAKILIQYNSIDNDYFEFDEISVIHNDSEVELLNYGQLSATLTSTASPGIGTYSSYLSGQNINIDITPNVGLAKTVVVNSIIVSVANTSSTGVSTSTLNTGLLDSNITSIASSISPISTTISKYSNEYNCGYYIVSVEDKTNSQYQLSEIVVVNDDSSSYITEFGILNTNTSLGNFDTQTDTQNTYLNFTPIENIDVEVRVFQNAVTLFDSTATNLVINLNSI